MNQKITRLSNIELLRVLAMLCIVASHYAVHGLNIYQSAISRQETIHYILSIGGGIGVDCFVLVSGYFMVQSRISMTKISKLLFQIISFSSVFVILAMVVGAPFFEVTIRSALKSSLGVFGGYWFINAYVGLMMLVPFLNAMIKNMDKKNHLLCIIVLIMMSSFLPTYMHIPTYVGWLGLFVVLYLIAAYFRLYGVPSYKIKSIMLALSLVLLGTIGSICITSRYCAILKPFMYSLLIDRQALPIIIISVLIFAVFVRLHVSYSKIINYAAASTLGVYLFHEHPLMRDFIWQKVLHTAEAPFCQSPVLHCIGSIIGVYVVGTIAHIIWQQTIGRLYAPAERFVIIPIYTRMKKWGNGIIQRIINQS